MNITHIIAFMLGGFVSLAAYAFVKIGADAEKYEQRLESLNDNFDWFANDVVRLWNEDELGDYPELKSHYVGRIMQIFQ